MSNLTDLVKVANRNLMLLAKEGESMLELAERIRNDINAPDIATQRLNTAIAMQSSYEFEVRRIVRDARAFREQIVLGDQARLKRAYDSDFNSAVNRVQNARDISRDEAEAVVEQLIIETSLEAVLPECGRLENAIRARSIVSYSL